MISRTVLLACDPHQAFALFTEQISTWWPVSHRPSKSSEGQLVLDPLGPFFERAADGTETPLGRVLEWRPPHHLLLDFYLGTSPTAPTAVTVTFTPQGSGTLVKIHHSPKPESQALWDQRASVYERSWASVLAALANQVTTVLRSGA